MVEMEKISFPPLIEHLKNQEDLYNSLYQSHELNKGAVDSIVLLEWMVEIAEPILEKVHEHNPDALSRVGPALFSSILLLNSGNSAVVSEEENKSALKLCLQMPKLVSNAPSKILKAINDAVKVIRTYQPQRVNTWIQLMNQSVVACREIDHLLDCGRVCAWFCGLAHLRENAKTAFHRLPEAVQNSITSHAPNNNFVNLFENSWLGNTSKIFKTTVGDFIGYESVFENPPVIAKIDNHVFATDGKNAHAVFCDEFGSVLLDQNSFKPIDIMERVSHSAKALPKINWEDISSSVENDHTVFLTRKSSFHIYVFQK